MNKKIKLLVIFNCISYALMGFIYYIVINDMISELNNMTKFSIVNISWILIVCTSFILASDGHKEFKAIKKEAIFDWLIRIIAFVVVIYGTKYFENSYIICIFIISAFIINSFIEYVINKKVANYNEAINRKEKIEISYQEKCNLNNMIKSVNLSMFSYVIFAGISLSVPINKNMEGTTSRWYIPVIFSILIYTWFIKINYKNYNRFYLNKKYAKDLFAKDVVFISIGYTICLVSAFLNLSYQLYGYIILVGALFNLPMINTVRKMSLRLKEIRDALGKDTYNYFINKMD